MSEEATTSVPTSGKQCIIHQLSFKSGHHDDKLHSPTSYDSWCTLLEAARIRNYDPVLEIEKTLAENEVPSIVYHRYCRSIFTLKRSLETLKEKKEHTADKDIPEKRQRLERSSSSDSRVYKQLCIFCEKVKYKKGQKTRENLIQAKELRVDQTLREVATRKGDSKILALTSREVVAAEAHYHRSCYRSYTKKTDSSCPDQEKDQTDDDPYQKAEKEAFGDLVQYIREELMANPDIIPLTDLTNKLKDFMLSKGITDVTDSTKKNIQKKLKNVFEDELLFFPDNKRRVLVMPKSLDCQELGRRVQSLKIELSVFHSEGAKILEQAALCIRQKIKDSQMKALWPLNPTDVDALQECIPDDLIHFFTVLLTGDPTNLAPSEKVRRLSDSMSSDIVYAVTAGRQKTPKHILLAYAIKTLTGNVELLRIVNRLGHCTSGLQLEENDTALCLQKLACTRNQRAILPQQVQPYVFTNLSWDNIDRLEATVTGGGTSHRVNGIAVQPRVFGPHPPKDPLPVIEKTKKRALPVDTQELRMYVSGKRPGPQPLQDSTDCLQEHKAQATSARKKDLLWMLARTVDAERQTVPAWTGFNIQTRDQVSVSADTVSYLPTINAPATDMATVQEILVQSEAIRTTLQLDNVVIVMDQALYAKAAEIVWKNREQYNHLILRLGTFHTIMNVLAILGKRFRDAGLSDLCIESGILAEGSVAGVMDGKMYKRAVRVHKIILEALLRLIWQCFIPWVKDNHSESLTTVNEVEELVADFHQDIHQAAFSTLLQQPVMGDFFSLWDTFLDHLRHDNGDLSAFWMTYVDIVQDVLLGLIRAAREGNWDLHLHAIRQMIPWCFAYDRLNYARHLPVYYAQMTNLAVDYPEIYQAFQDGNFAVQLTDQNPFGRIPVDQTTEVTVNRDTQTVGGTTKFSLKPGAVSRYYLTAEQRSGFLTKLRNIVQLNKHGSDHPDLLDSRRQKDEESVAAVEETLESWTNPFEENLELMSISTGTAAPKDVAQDIKIAQTKGENAYAAFKTERLATDPPAKKFHDPLKKSSLKTFGSAAKKKQTKCGDGRSLILRADRWLFGRMIVMGQSRNLNMKDLMCYPLGPLPWSLAAPDGSLRKTNKAALANSIKKNAPLADSLPDHSVTIIDGMGLVQRAKFDGQQPTFAEVAERIFSMAVNEGSASDRIDVVFDCYKKLSIKCNERANRSRTPGLSVQNITPGQKIKQWRKFLQQEDNKTNLVQFLVNEWNSEKYLKKLGQLHKILYVTCEEKCYRFSAVRRQDVAELQSFQEEADGRLLLHASHAAQDGFEAVMISSNDTDVMVLNLAFCGVIKTPMYQKFGSGTRTQLVDITKAAEALGPTICSALPGMHSFTGCDSVSSFAGKGKLAAMKMLRSDKEAQETFSDLGKNWELSDELFDKLESFTCRMYAPKQPASGVNELRYQLFCAKSGDTESHQLPPCQDCLRKHAQRANYQTALWQRCLSGDSEIADPTKSGWKKETQDGEEILAVDWMSVKPAPDAVLELLACQCPRSCTLPNCICLQNDLKCTDMCRAKDCENQPGEDDTEVLRGDVVMDEDEEDEN